MEKNIDAELKVDDPTIRNTLSVGAVTEFEVDDPKKIESPFLYDSIKGYNPFEGTEPVGIYCAQREIYEEEN